MQLQRTIMKRSTRMHSARLRSRGVAQIIIAHYSSHHCNDCEYLLRCHKPCTSRPLHRLAIAAECATNLAPPKVCPKKRLAWRARNGTRFCYQRAGHLRVCVSTSKAYLFNACVSKAQRQRTANALQATRSGRLIESPPLHKYGASAFHSHFRRIASAQRKCSVSTAQIRRASAT